jgi:outer membrane receptor for ferrienterochelin and colicin
MYGLCAIREPFRDKPVRSGASFYKAMLPLTILCLWFAQSVSAQQTGKDLSEASLEELTNIQVYSASKHMQSASEAPSSVTVITADEIHSDQAQCVRESDLAILKGFRIKVSGRVGRNMTETGYWGSK